MRRVVIGVLAIMLVPFIVLALPFAVLVKPFLKKRNEELVQDLVNKYGTNGYEVYICESRREAELVLGRGVAGHCNGDKRQIVLRHAWRKRNIVDTFFHELRHAEQQTCDELRNKYFASSLALKVGKVNYKEAWHEQDARVFAAEMTAMYLKGE